MARSGAASAETANSSSTRRNQLPTGPTLLRRGSDAVKPEKAPPKPKARAEKPSKDDPNHPLRGGKQRKIKFAPRPARRKGSDEWLARQIDSHQELVLRKAFEISEDPTRCLEVCRWQRQMGRLHTDCPLKMPEKEELRCTDEKCNCKPHYQQLVGKQGGMGTGKPDFVRRAPLAFSNARLSTSPRAPPLLAVCRVASCELLCSCGWVRARTRPPTHSRMCALGGADSGDGARPRGRCATSSATSARRRGRRSRSRRRRRQRRRRQAAPRREAGRERLRGSGSARTHVTQPHRCVWGGGVRYTKFLAHLLVELRKRLIALQT